MRVWARFEAKYETVINAHCGSNRVNHGGEISIFVFPSLIEFFAIVLCVYARFRSFYISRRFPVLAQHRAVLNFLSLSISTSLTKALRPAAPAYLLARSISFFIDMYEIIFLLYAALVHLGRAAYTVQDNFNATNWADAFEFFTVEPVNLDIVNELSTLIVR